MGVELELWPEHGGGPLWEGGTSIDLDALPLSGALRDRLVRWNAVYDDSLLAPGTAHEAWRAEGRSLLAELREELGEGVSITVAEDWWDESDPR